MAVDDVGPEQQALGRAVVLLVAAVRSARDDQRGRAQPEPNPELELKLWLLLLPRVGLLVCVNFLERCNAKKRKRATSK